MEEGEGRRQRRGRGGRGGEEGKETKGQNKWKKARGRKETEKRKAEKRGGEEGKKAKKQKREIGRREEGTRGRRGGGVGFHADTAIRESMVEYPKWLEPR